MSTAPGAPRPSRLNKWWPIGFFIGAVVCFIIGGALVGTWVSNSYDDCSYSNSSSYYSSYYSDYSCISTNMGQFYGAIALFVIGGVLKLTAWILLIIFCIKRNRLNRHTVTYVNSPPVQQTQPFTQPYAAPQPTYAPPHQTAQFTGPPASPDMVHSGMAGSSMAGTPPPKEASATATGFKYCGQCGTAVSSRFCPQCGSQS
ncbi:unnamed protein product [Penicillium salamii]|uniref:Uncharacterized protein n=1 Tax=Penicillium salamii TaxID=1612424 RepID=A0A9W4IDA8_9EURO|nr:unnamed protein product [Penicillium salamii]CAG8235427.1 unnamed protein product [Penicillium salamii]CAG8256519.1 unnamed protein product [Penicillium salamii]CAG8260059.1 unnamed protein product [Penicillium salamii]CAG8347748.1 unnamed protein product [Penicillium salamii]